MICLQNTKKTPRIFSKGVKDIKKKGQEQKEKDGYDEIKSETTGLCTH